MPEQHTWETAVAAFTDRLPVAGGWIYVIHVNDNDVAVFVPHPPPRYFGIDLASKDPAA